MTHPYKLSVIIPTIGRSSLLASVDSVCTQIGCDVEAIVVLDLPEREHYVSALLKGRTYKLILADGNGASAARNKGLLAATGDYISYLDDDDLWLPAKGYTQIKAILASLEPRRAISVADSEFVRAGGEISRSRPRRYNPHRESLANFLVARRALRFGSVSFNTPALLGSSELMKRYLWDETLRKHQDWDLYVRLVDRDHVNVIVVEETLARVHQGSLGSISKRSNWRESAAWLEKHESYVTGRSKADFILIHILLNALRRRSGAGVNYAIRALRLNVPHLAAVFRLVSGLVADR